MDAPPVGPPSESIRVPELTPTLKDQGRGRSREAPTPWRECTWSDALFDADALRQLRIAAVAVPGTSASTRLALFGRDGFTDRVRSIAEQEGILLFGAADLLRDPAPSSAAPG